MRLRIVRPVPDELEGIDVRNFLFGAAYEVLPPLCDVLIVLGYAVPESQLTASEDEPTQSKSVKQKRRRPRK